MVRTYHPYRRKQKIQTWILSSLLGLIIAYFCFHALSGEKGIFAAVHLTHDLEALHSSLDEVRAERLQLEHRVNLMRSHSLDLDLLDEQARKQLGYAASDEKVMLLPKDS